MSQTTDDRAAWLLELALPDRQVLLARMNEREKQLLRHHWRLWAHTGQLPPPGDWQTWMILAGRGFGKTRAGAEWVRAIAQADPQARIALVGATLAEARSVMVEGDSGLLTISPRGMRPRFEPSRRLLTWPNGAQAALYSAGEPDSLRGPQQSHACRPEPEGNLCQRGPHPTGRPAPLRGRSPSANPADCTPGRPVLAGGFEPWRGLERTSWRGRLLPARPVAVSAAARWTAIAEQGDRPAPAPLRVVANSSKAGFTGRRGDDRCPMPRRDRGNRRNSYHCRHSGSPIAEAANPGRFPQSPHRNATLLQHFRTLPACAHNRIQLNTDELGGSILLKGENDNAETGHWDGTCLLGPRDACFGAR